MPEFVVAIIAVIGIVLVGLAFTAIDLVKDVGKIIGTALVTFLVIVLIGQLLGLFGTSSDTPEYSRSDNIPRSDNFTDSASNTFNNVTRTLSDWLNTGFERLDSFVYDTQDPYIYPDQLGQPSGPNAPVEQPPSGQTELPVQAPEVPSRVSRITGPSTSVPAEANRPDPSSGSPASSRASTPVNGARRPVSGLW